jgi:hypothetical protein
MRYSLIINHNWNYVGIKWRSKSGRIYDIADEDIACDDVEFWIEGLEPDLYYKQLYPGDKLPFKLKDLTYELVVNRLSLYASLEMTLKPGAQSDAEFIKDQVSHFIADFNLASEKKNLKYGAIHTAKGYIEDIKIVFELDLGTVGPGFYQKILKFLSRLNYFDKVEIN